MISPEAIIHSTHQNSHGLRISDHFLGATEGFGRVAWLCLATLNFRVSERNLHRQSNMTQSIVLIKRIVFLQTIHMSKMVASAVVRRKTKMSTHPKGQAILGRNAPCPITGCRGSCRLFYCEQRCRFLGVPLVGCTRRTEVVQCEQCDNRISIREYQRRISYRPLIHW